MTERATLPILAERIEAVDKKVTAVDSRVEKQGIDFTNKVNRMYALQATAIGTMIVGIVVALVTR